MVAKPQEPNVEAAVADVAGTRVSSDLCKALPDAGQKLASYTKEDCPSPSIFFIFAL